MSGHRLFEEIQDRPVQCLQVHMETLLFLQDVVLLEKERDLLEDPKDILHHPEKVF